MAITPQPIEVVSTISGNSPRGARIAEAATQTFKLGTPVELDGSGNVAAWDGTTITLGIAGITTEPGANLTTAGTALTVTFGSVPFQSSAVNIPRGAPFNDGKNGFFVGDDDTVYRATFGNNGNAATPAKTDVGIAYGMTKDATSGFWYVDKNKTGGNAVLRITEQDPRDGTVSAGTVRFVFLKASIQVVA